MEEEIKNSQLPERKKGRLNKILKTLIVFLVGAIFGIVIVNPFGIKNLGDFLKFRTAVNILKNNYYQEIDEDSLADFAITGVAMTPLDPYTEYIPKEYAEDFMLGINAGDYEGVGLTITNNMTDNTIEIVSATVDSPAYEAGLRTGDKILKVDGVAYTGDKYSEAADNMRGEAGTKVTLTVRKADSGKEEDVTIQRRSITIETVSGELLEEDIGYIRITQFGENTAREFADCFNDLAHKDMERLIIDLRDNAGGYMSEAIAIADMFIDDGTIVYTQGRDGRERYYDATEGKTKLPVVILQNKGTASASEILIGALKDYDLAETVGEKTYGKGVTQTPITFRDGSILKFTDSIYCTPKGTKIHGIGISPDTVVEEEELQLKKAVELIKNQEV